MMPKAVITDGFGSPHSTHDLPEDVREDEEHRGKQQEQKAAERREEHGPTGRLPF